MRKSSKIRDSIRIEWLAVALYTVQCAVCTVLIAATSQTTNYIYFHEMLNEQQTTTKNGAPNCDSQNVLLLLLLLSCIRGHGCIVADKMNSRKMKMGIGNEWKKNGKTIQMITWYTHCTHCTHTEVRMAKNNTKTK